MLIAKKEETLLLIDWDNLFTSLWNDFGQDKLRLPERIERLMNWVKTDIGRLLGGIGGFVFAPEHLSFHHKQMFLRHGFNFFICPKKVEEDGSILDTVDEKIISFGRLMMRHPDVGIICLVSGDSDYVPLFEIASIYGVKRALAPPTLNSLSKDKDLTDLIDNHPITGKRMVLRLDELEED